MAAAHGYNATKQQRKNYFLIVSEYFSYRIGPIDMVRGSISSLDIGTFILAILGTLCMFWGIRAPPNGANKYSNARRWAGCMAQSISFKMSP
jgi:hypothetical protein